MLVAWFERWAIALGIVAITTLVAFAYGWHVKGKRDEAAYNARAVAAIIESAKETGKLTAKFDDLKRATDETARLNAGTIAALNDSLRNRADRPKLPSAASNDTGCTGAGLYQSDARFLVGQAAEAQEIGRLLDVCQIERASLRDAMAKSNSKRQ